jgi:hypothetical protein
MCLREGVAKGRPLSPCAASHNGDYAKKSPGAGPLRLAATTGPQARLPAAHSILSIIPLDEAATAGPFEIFAQLVGFLTRERTDLCRVEYAAIALVLLANQ